MSSWESTDLLWVRGAVIHRGVRPATPADTEAPYEPRGAILSSSRRQAIPPVGQDAFVSGGLVFTASYFDFGGTVEDLPGAAVHGMVYDRPKLAVSKEIRSGLSLCRVFRPLVLRNTQVVQTQWSGPHISVWNVTDHVAYAIEDGSIISPVHTARMGGSNVLNAYAVFDIAVDITVEVN